MHVRKLTIASYAACSEFDIETSFKCWHFHCRSSVTLAGKVSKIQQWPFDMDYSSHEAPGTYKYSCSMFLRKQAFFTADLAVTAQNMWVEQVTHTLSN